MSQANTNRCVRCQSELSSGSGYCVSCGFQNVDLTERMVGAEMARRDQLDKLKARVALSRMFGGIFRFLGR